MLGVAVALCMLSHAQLSMLFNRGNGIGKLLEAERALTALYVDSVDEKNSLKTPYAACWAVSTRIRLIPRLKRQRPWESR